MKWMFYRDELEAVFRQYLPAPSYYAVNHHDTIWIRPTSNKNQSSFSHKMKIDLFFRRLIKFNINITPWRNILTTPKDFKQIPEILLKQLQKLEK